MIRARRIGAAALMGLAALGLALAPVGAEAKTGSAVSKGRCTIKVTLQMDWHGKSSAAWTIYPKPTGAPTVRPEFLRVWVIKPDNSLAKLDSFSARLQLKRYDKKGKPYYFTIESIGSGKDDIEYDWIAAKNQPHLGALDYPTWLITVDPKEHGKCTMRTAEISW